MTDGAVAYRLSQRLRGRPSAATAPAPHPDPPALPHWTNGKVERFNRTLLRKMLLWRVKRRARRSSPGTGRLAGRRRA